MNPEQVINPTGVDSTAINKITGVENLDNTNNPNQNQIYNLRVHRKRNYTHLKGRNNDGSLTVGKDTVQKSMAEPRKKLKKYRHFAHVILEHIFLTQYNLKQ